MSNRKQRRNFIKSLNTPQKMNEYIAVQEENIRRHYEQEYKKAMLKSIDDFLIAITYTLHFNEKTKFGNDRIADFMDDLIAVVEGFKTGEYSPEEYKDILEKQKIYFRGNKK